MRTTINVSDYVGREVEKRVSSIRSRPQIIQDALEAYFDLFETTRQRLKGLLTMPEAMVILDTVNGWMVRPASHATLLPYSISDAARYENVGQRFFSKDSYKEDLERLIDKLNELSPFQLWVIVSLFQDFWERNPATIDDQQTFEERLRNELYPLIQ